MDIVERTDQLIPAFHLVAVHFADLHDSPIRMLAKNCIRGIVEWRDSRRHFFWRLRRRLLQEQQVKRIQRASASVKWAEATVMIRQWLLGDNLNEKQWLDDSHMVEMLIGQDLPDSIVSKCVRNLQAETATQQIMEAINVCSTILFY